MQPKSFVWDDNLELFSAVLTAANDLAGTAVDVEPGGGIAVGIQVAAACTGTTPTVDFQIQASDDGGSTYRDILVFPQIAEAQIETVGQRRFIGYACLPPLEAAYKAAGGTHIKLREYSTLGNADNDFGQVDVLVAGVQLPSNAPTGIVDVAELV